MTYFLSLNRAKEAFTSFNGDETALAHLMYACQDVVEKYLQRKVLANTYDEIYSSHGDGQLILAQFPVSEIKRLSYNPFAVLKIGIGTPSLGTRATVQVKSDRLILTYGTDEPEEFLYTDHPTLADMQTAITSYGWSCTASFEDMPSVELKAFPGVFNARGLTGLRAFIMDQWSMRFDAEAGIIYAPIPRGAFNTRVVYRGGWEEGCVPESIIKATADLVKASWLEIDRDPSVSSLTIESYSTTLVPTRLWDNLGLVSKYGLNLYRSRTPARWREGGMKL